MNRPRLTSAVEPRRVGELKAETPFRFVRDLCMVSGLFSGLVAQLGESLAAEVVHRHS